MTLIVHDSTQGRQLGSLALVWLVILASVIIASGLGAGVSNTHMNGDQFLQTDTPSDPPQEQGNGTETDTTTPATDSVDSSGTADTAFGGPDDDSASGSTASEQSTNNSTQGNTSTGPVFASPGDNSKSGSTDPKTSTDSKQSSEKSKNKDTQFKLSKCGGNWWNPATAMCIASNKITDIILDGIRDEMSSVGQTALTIALSTPVPHTESGDIAFFTRPANDKIWQSLYDLWWGTVLPLSLLLWALSILIMWMARVFTPGGGGYEIVLRRKLYRALLMGLVICCSWAIVVALLSLVNLIVTPLIPSHPSGAYVMADMLQLTDAVVLLDPIGIGAWIGILFLYLVLLLIALVRLIYLLYFIIGITVMLPLTLWDFGPLQAISDWADRFIQKGVQFLVIPIPIALTFAVGFAVLHGIGDAQQKAMRGFLASPSLGEAAMAGGGGAFLVLGGVDMLVFFIWLCAVLSPFIFTVPGQQAGRKALGLGFLASKSLQLAKLGKSAFGSRNSSADTDPNQTSLDDFNDQTGDDTDSDDTGDDSGERSSRSKPELPKRPTPNVGRSSSQHARQRHVQGSVIQQTPWGPGPTIEQTPYGDVPDALTDAASTPATPTARRALLRNEDDITPAYALEDLPDESFRIGTVTGEGDFESQFDAAVSREDLLRGDGDASTAYYTAADSLDDPIAVKGVESGQLYDPSPMKVSPPQIRSATSHGVSGVVEIGDRQQLPDGFYQFGTIDSSGFAPLGDNVSFDRDAIVNSDEYKDLKASGRKDLYLRHTNSGRIFYDTDGPVDNDVMVASERGIEGTASSGRSLSPTMTESQMLARGANPTPYRKYGDVLENEYQLVRVDEKGAAQPLGGYGGQLFSGRDILDPESEFSHAYTEAHSDLSAEYGIPIGIRETTSGEIVDVSPLINDGTAYEHAVQDRYIREAQDDVYDRD